MSKSKNPCEKLYQPPTQSQIPNLWWSQKVRYHKTTTGKKSFGQFQINFDCWPWANSFNFSHFQKHIIVLLKINYKSLRGKNLTLIFFFLMGMKLKNCQWSVWVCKRKIKFSDSWGKLPLKTWFVKIQNLKFNIQGSMGKKKVLFKISFINWKLKTAAIIRLL